MGLFFNITYLSLNERQQKVHITKCLQLPVVYGVSSKYLLNLQTKRFASSEFLPLTVSLILLMYRRTGRNRATSAFYVYNVMLGKK